MIINGKQYGMDDYGHKILLLVLMLFIFCMLQAGKATTNNPTTNSVLE